MAFDERLALRVRTALQSRANVSEKKMFGGLAFMLGSKMFCGIVGDDLMVRVGPDRYQECLALPHVREMDFTGKPMKGYVFVGPPGRRTARSLQRWMDRGIDFVSMTSQESPKERKGRSTSLFVALLRGINVGGKNKMPMKDLAGIFESAGCTDVRTYIQSGNVVFGASAAVARKVSATATEVIRERVGPDIPVIIRTGAELRGVVRSNPFVKAGLDPGSLHVAFLATKPSVKRVRGLDPNRSPGDSFQLRGRDLYLHLPNGVARSKLNNAWIDNQLATTSTIRNWRTVLKLVEMAGG